MDELKFALLADGPSDDALLPILTWVLVQRLPETPIQPQWADLRHVVQPTSGLEARVRIALEFYPCDVLFVHRDAEREPGANRVEEIRRAVETIPDLSPYVCVVPVRMMEAWLIFDEPALRRAAGNPNGQMPLALPRLAEVEALPDPKQTLRDLLRAASGRGGRRLKNFRVAPRRVASLIDDFSPLRALSAFQSLEAELDSVLALGIGPE